MIESNLLTTKEAIQRRRSIRKFKPDPIPEEYIIELLESARLSPSECNTQPWRFKIVKDKKTKQQLAQAAYNQDFIADAPVVVICCANIKTYVDEIISSAIVLNKRNKFNNQITDVLMDRASVLISSLPNQVGLRIAPNIVISIEHIVLRALDFGLGTCWVTMIDGLKVNHIFDWSDNIFVVAFLLIGYPVKIPHSSKRLPLNKIIIR
jgi:nitroreductase